MRRSRFSGAGYWLNDDTASGGKKNEDDILVCGHCQRVIKKKEWLNDGGCCHQCDEPLCGDIKHANGFVEAGCAALAIRDGSQSLAAPGNIVTSGCANFRRFV